METPIGLVPEPGGLDIAGLDVTEQELAAALRVDRAEWQSELPLIREWFATVGERLPASLRRQLELLEAGLAH